MTTTAKFPGKKVVAGGCITLSVTSGLSFYGLAVYLNAFSNEKGWSLSSISFATTVFFITGGLVGLWVARALTRIDPRRVMVLGSLVGALALGTLGLVSSPWMLYLNYIVLSFGFSAVGLVPVTTVVTRWYNRGRSVALSWASSGLSFGGMALTPIAKWLTDHLGLATSGPILAAIWLVGSLPTILFLIKPDPAELGWLPDGDRAAADYTPPPPQGTPFATAIRSRFFLLTAVAFVLMMASQVGGIQQMVKLSEERTGPTAAAFIVLVVSAMSVVGRLATAPQMHRIPMGLLTVVLSILQGLALIGLALTNITWLFFVVAGLFGATVGLLLMLQSLIISEAFGVRDYARLFSRMQLVVMIGSAGGPLLLGWLYDLSGDYFESYLVAGIVAILGAAVMWLAGPVKPHSQDDPTQTPARAEA